jgi:hypothetical protein
VRIGEVDGGFDIDRADGSARTRHGDIIIHRAAS